MIMNIICIIFQVESFQCLNEILVHRGSSGAHAATTTTTTTTTTTNTNTNTNTNNDNDHNTNNDTTSQTECWEVRPTHCIRHLETRGSRPEQTLTLEGCNSSRQGEPSNSSNLGILTPRILAARNRRTQSRFSAERICGDVFNFRKVDCSCRLRSV